MTLHRTALAATCCALALTFFAGTAQAQEREADAHHHAHGATNIQVAPATDCIVPETYEDGTPLTPQELGEAQADCAAASQEPVYDDAVNEYTTEETVDETINEAPAH